MEAVNTCDPFIGQSGIIISGEESVEWSDGNMFNGNNLSFVTWFEDSTDPNLGILTASNPNWVSNDVFGFVERDGEIYECVIEFWVGEFSGQQFFDTYAGLSTSMYIESITVAEEPFLGGEEITGCTDNTAENYNPDATAEDGSCEYDCDTWLDTEELYTCYWYV